MKNIYQKLKPYLFFLFFIICLSFLTSVLNILGIRQKITSLFLLLIVISLFFLFGFKYGKKALKKGYLAGLKAGFSYLIIFWLLNLLLFRSPFGLSQIIYYLILLISSIFGSIIGINKKTKDD